MSDKKKTNPGFTDDDPTGGHEPAALEDAKEKMHISDPSKSVKRDPDPPGGHDPAALEDAAKKMGVER
jgi:hypothetical protein